MPKSELAKRLADYEELGEEPPEVLRTNPERTEGELMNGDDIAEFIKDSIATLRILADKESPGYQKVLANYHLDLDYLHKVGGISDDDYNDLIHPDNLHF